MLSPAVTLDTYPDTPAEFWGQWVREHPGKEPLIEAWVNLWEELLTQWQGEHHEDFPGSPWSNHDEWMDFPWEDHVVEFSIYTGEAMALDWSLDQLRDAVNEHVSNRTQPTLELITGAELPQRFNPDRGLLTWEQVDQQVRKHPEVRIPLDLLSTWHQDMLWTEVINEWDMGDEEPRSDFFETKLPAWMVTWLENHPDSWLCAHYDLKKQQPSDGYWKHALTEHELWKVGL